MNTAYLDANATTRPLSRVLEVVHQTSASARANPSSRHRPGQEARAALDAARARFAEALEVEAGAVVFTSGASEANRLALQWALRRGKLQGRTVVVTSPTEHPSLRDPLLRAAARGEVEVRWLEVDADGVVRPASLEALIDDKVALVSVMAANNETGVLQPLSAVIAASRAHGALVHTDASQALGRVPIKLGDAVDLISLSAHKAHGPRGVGCLIANTAVAWAPYSDGGHQEGGRRAGTEDVAAAAGFALAARHAVAGLGAMPDVSSQRDRLEGLCVTLGARVNGGGSLRLPNTTSVAFEGLDGATLVLELAKRGVCVSTGSACLSAAFEPSHVLIAMGLDANLAKGSLRFSLSRLTKSSEVNHALRMLPEVVDRVRRLA